MNSFVIILIPLQTKCDITLLSRNVVKKFLSFGILWYFWKILILHDWLVQTLDFNQLWQLIYGIVLYCVLFMTHNEDFCIDKHFLTALHVNAVFKLHVNAVFNSTLCLQLFFCYFTILDNYVIDSWLHPVCFLRSLSTVLCGVSITPTSSTESCSYIDARIFPIVIVCDLLHSESLIFNILYCCSLLLHCC